MPNITNVKRAFDQISEKSLKYEGELNLDTFMGFFNHAVKEFNLSPEKVIKLKGMAYPVEVKGANLTENAPKAKKPELNEDDITVIMLESIKSLTEQVVNLTGALAKIGTLTGYGNHLREFKIDRWEPTKKDMNKYRS